MPDQFIVTINGNWTRTITARSSSDAMVEACNEWRRLFSDGEDRGLIETLTSHKVRDKS